AFTVVGTDIALDGGFAAGPAVILGVISGVGGGIIRDVLAGRRIAIFTGEVYALAALAGSVAFLASRGLGPLAPFLIGVSIALIIRLGAVTMGWRVPTLPTDGPRDQ
ncbi:MAG: TRIC cation channel family protein, partial [Candidatus Nanopelagicales bacterium]